MDEVVISVLFDLKHENVASRAITQVLLTITVVVMGEKLNYYINLLG